MVGALLGIVSAFGTLLFDKYLEQILLWQSSFGMCEDADVLSSFDNFCTRVSRFGRSSYSSGTLSMLR